MLLYHKNLFSDIISNLEIEKCLKIYQLQKLQDKLYKNKKIIIVHQMGKVGSSSIYNSLKTLNNDSVILHTHYLNPQIIRSTIIKRKESNQPILRHLIESIILSNSLQDKSKKIKIISLTREPISRNISAFFESIKNYVPNGLSKYRHNGASLDVLHQTFINKFPHYHCLKWIDLEIYNLTNIDIYRLPFNTKRGYQTYDNSSNTSLLMIRLESLNTIEENAIASFLEIKSFSLANSNVGKNKQYNNIYQKFKQNIILPPELIKSLYESKYTTHFYSPAEIKFFSQKWQNNLFSNTNKLRQ